jgi:hypothetical protein
MVADNLPAPKFAAAQVYQHAARQREKTIHENRRNDTKEQTKRHERDAEAGLILRRRSRFFFVPSALMSQP